MIFSVDLFFCYRYYLRERELLLCDIQCWSLFLLQILFEGKRAVGVKFLKPGGYSHEVFANKEVIVSAGAINSPHLLLLSGVGPKEQLQKHGVS